MRLSSAQLTTFQTWLANSAAGLSDEAAANLANATASPNYFVWNPSADASAVDAGIDKSAYTPADSPPVTGNATSDTNAAMLFNNRAQVALLKQFNANWLTGGRIRIDASLTQVRKNFQDCLRQIPTGASGANQDAGWGTPAVPGTARLALMNKATNFEKLFTVVATGVANDGGTRGTNTSPDNYGVDADGMLLYGPLVTSQLVAELRG